MHTTTLTPEALAELRTLGWHQANMSPYVNPTVAAQVKRVLAERGEPWAASVLGRDLSRRSIFQRCYPWFECGEIETLVLADHAE
ncbi:hypothetical protein AB0C34_17025 [Nocardia sp. NPDC049220]|uniref:hypothetical protein n=1 Tax=Nocardia sp. NPDC049220 TaxID=3155273 RepID=UPI0034068C01